MRVGALATPRRVAVTGLVAGAGGIAILKAAGVGMPLVPPGLVLLLGAAIAVAIWDTRWTGVFAVVIGLAELAGIFASGSAANLFDPASLLVGVGTWIRFVGVVTATIAGFIVAARRRPVSSPA